MTICIPGNAAGASGNFQWPAGIAFATGIAYTLTGGVGDTDTTALSTASEVVINALYK